MSTRREQLKQALNQGHITAATVLADPTISDSDLDYIFGWNVDNGTENVDAELNAATRINETLGDEDE